MKKDLYYIPFYTIWDSMPDVSSFETDENHMICLNADNISCMEAIQKDPMAYESKHILNIIDNYMGQDDMTEHGFFEMIKHITMSIMNNTTPSEIQDFAVYCANPENRFLQRIHDGDISLVDDLVKHQRYGTKAKKKYAASLVCACFDIALERKLDYPVMGNGICDALPYYLSAYHVSKSKNFGNLCYQTFYSMLCQLAAKSGLQAYDLHQLLMMGYPCSHCRVG